MGYRPWGCKELGTTDRIKASLVAQLVKNLPAMLETWVQSLGWEDPLEKGTATHSSILAWRIPRTKEPGGLQAMGLQRVARPHDFHFHFKLTHSSTGKESACNASGDLSWIPGLGRSPREGNGSHSSILAWRIPWIEEHGGLYHSLALPVFSKLT